MGKKGANETCIVFRQLEYILTQLVSNKQLKNSLTNGFSFISQSASPHRKLRIISHLHPRHDGRYNDTNSTIDVITYDMKTIEDSLASGEMVYAANTCSHVSDITIDESNCTLAVQGRVQYMIKQKNIFAFFSKIIENIDISNQAVLDVCGYDFIHLRNHFEEYVYVDKMQVLNDSFSNFDTTFGIHR